MLFLLVFIRSISSLTIAYTIADSSLTIAYTIAVSFLTIVYTIADSSLTIAYTIADEDGDAVKQIIEEEIIELEMLHEGNIVTIDETDMTEQDYLTSVKEDSPEHVVADSLDEMNEILHDYFDRTSTRFAVTVSKGIKNSGFFFVLLFTPSYSKVWKFFKSHNI